MHSCAVIMVVEGPSAAGKTTWLSRWPAELAVPETSPVDVPTVPVDDEARFWVEHNTVRWHQAVRTEAEHGLALCDSDPLKLSYDYCRARVGAAPWTLFLAELDHCTRAIRRRRLGIADLVLCSIPDEATLARRRLADPTRRRHNFDVNRRLGPALRDWYATLDALDPGRIRWTLPDEIPDAPARERYDTDLFEAWMGELPGRPRP